MRGRWSQEYDCVLRIDVDPLRIKVSSFHADESGHVYTYPAVELYSSNLVGVHGGQRSGGVVHID